MTRAFVGRGKATGFKLLKEEDHQSALALLGNSFNPSQEVFVKCESFVCAMYGRLDCDRINDVRYWPYGTKACLSSQLPPCQDSLKFHVLWANYQAAVWKRSLVSNPVIPSPVGCGWKAEPDGSLAIQWNDIQPAPSALLECISCACSRACSNRRCSCLLNGLRCTGVCRCAVKKCRNRPQTAGVRHLNDEKEAVEYMSDDVNSSAIAADISAEHSTHADNTGGGGGGGGGGDDDDDDDD